MSQVEAVFSLIPSDEPTEEPIPDLEHISPTPVFLLPPKSDPAFQRACHQAKMATNAGMSMKKISKTNQERALRFAMKWITGTKNCPTLHKDKDGKEKTVELGEIDGWKNDPLIIPKILAVGEKYHTKEVVDDDTGNV